MPSKLQIHADTRERPFAMATWKSDALVLIILELMEQRKYPAHPKFSV
jgi:hypothetical protein